MWRAIFMALGISFCILGAECLVVDRAILARNADPSEVQALVPDMTVVSAKRVVTPPEWAPFALLSFGTVVILYSRTFSQGG